jgi:glycosyltransferase involved in cell wall biosynthesis
VVHLTNQLDVGGMEKLLVEFARHADRRRFDLKFVSFGGRGALTAEVEAAGWPVTPLGEAPGLRPGMVWRLARLLRHWKADVVHTHNSRPLLYGAPAARLAGVPAVVHTRHGQDCRATPRQTFLFRLATLLTNRVVCVSDDATRLTAAQGVAAGKLSRLWNGIDLTRFSYLGPCAGGPVVMVARMSPEKDTETLLRAAALAVRADATFRLEIAGDGACLLDLRRLTEELELAGHVHFHGAVRDVPALLSRASLFVLPSISEGVSLTLLEAMARGLPIIATRVGGNPEVVVDGETGFLVPPRSPEILAERLLHVLHRPVLGRALGLAGRQRVEQHFDVRKMLGRYEELYQRILHRSAA